MSREAIIERIYSKKKACAIKKSMVNFRRCINILYEENAGMIKKTLPGMAAVIAISLVLAACFVESDPTDNPKGEAFDSYSGTAEGSGTGYNGSTIKVTLTLTNGYITDVQIDGPGETPAIGGILIKNAPNQIKAANSLDAISGATATFTRDGIINAGKKALAEITNGVYGN
jgi:uncharacterized protein with FMN-binding domain